ncbi:hypothetical protein [Mesorhizobium sp.]|uniref:hypothetical protein n=1 Tax=Mesorhizobium sp. TaxID=1871066 RepID=UPI0011FCAF34|nr:hypothetical protein [Mesorhizobium sp.]TIP18408.1 MAG: hypothetical protein E5X66_15595 [Mesorhizobium sp.]
MKVHFRAQYLTSGVGHMRGVDYDSTLLVSAVKGKTLPSTQYATVKIGGKWVTITDKNKDKAIEWFAEWAVPLIKAAGIGPKVLVPIPNRSAVVGKKDTPRTAAIANITKTACGAGVVVADVLRWKKDLPKSTDSASRKPELLLPDLVLTSTIPFGTVVLIDDVFTSGGHAVASAWRLQDLNRTAKCAICCGRTLHVQIDDPFKVDDEELLIPKRP